MIKNSMNKSNTPNKIFLVIDIIFIFMCTAFAGLGFYIYSFDNVGVFNAVLLSCLLSVCLFSSIERLIVLAASNRKVKK